MEKKGNVSAMLRSINVNCGVMGAILAVATFLCLSARFSYARYVIAERAFSIDDWEFFFDYFHVGATVLAHALASQWPIFIIREVLARNTFVSSRVVSAAVHHQLAVFFTLVPVSAISGCAIYNPVINMVNGLWISAIIGCFVILAFAFELRNDEATEDLKMSAVLKFAIGHALLEVPLLLILIFYGDKIFQISSDRWLPIGAYPSVHFMIVLLVAYTMTIFTWFNARAACLGYSKKLVLSPIFWMVMLMSAFGPMLFTPHSRRFWCPMGIWFICTVFAAPVLLWGAVLNRNPPYSTTAPTEYRAIKA